MATSVVDVDFGSEYLAEKYEGVSVSICTITPDIAEAMLKRNTSNRPLNDNHARNLRDVMLAGDMVMNGETIIFARNGTLLNGQHRLTACVMSGTPFDSMVVRGIDVDAFKTMDRTRVRTSGDVLSMMGEHYAQNVASAVQALVSFVDHRGSVHDSASSARKVTPAMCERVLTAHPGIRDSVRAMKVNTLYRNQHAMMLHYLFSTINQRLADDFANILARGSNDITRPFVRLRESLIATPMRNELRRSYAAKAIKAFNAERSGARPKMFKFTSGDQFPAIAGIDMEWLVETLKP